MALPSTMLSICSAAVFAIVFFLLRSGSGHELFVLPFPATSVIGAVAAALSWLVAVKCRKRPGRLWPRLWSLVLAGINSAIALLGLLLFERSWALAFAVAGLTAAATLAMRLVKLRPDSAMVQWVGPASVALILLVILPTSCTVRRAITKKTEDRVEQRIQQFRLWTLEVKEATGFQWRRMEQSPAAAANAVAKLEKLKFRCCVDDAEIWRSAAVLGKDDELAEAMQALTMEVVAALAPPRVPRVSDLREAAIRWDAQQRRWESYTQFSLLSDVTGTYHHELGRLFTELESKDTSGTNAKLVGYRDHYAAQREQLRKHLDAVATEWADNWAVYRVPGHAALIGRERAALSDVLRASFIRGGDESFAPGQLWQLTMLPLYRLKAMAQGSSGCEGSDLAESPRPAPGCRCQSYDERNREYFRLDCYSYAPRKDETGAELRVEMRLVYQSAPGRPLPRATLPAEIFFHFVIPEDANQDKFDEEVMTNLADAARAFRRDERVTFLDRGSSVTDGFRIEDGRSFVHVLRPAVVPLTGLFPEPKALEVRVVRTQSRRIGG